MLKAYEDVLRHNIDREVNRTPVRIIRDGEFKMIKREEINVSKKNIEISSKWVHGLVAG